MKSNLDQAAPETPAADAPMYIKLLAPFGVHVEGKVMPYDVDFIARLNKAGVKFRPATDAERRIGGFPD